MSVLSGSTIKPGSNDNPWDHKVLAVVDRWSLFRGHLYCKSPNWDYKMVAVTNSWSLFGGGRQLRFDSTCNCNLTKLYLT